MREAVFRRDGGCLMRRRGGCFGRTTFHHLRKAGQGGPYTEANGVALCQFHNDDVEDHPDDYRELGLVVAKGVDHDEAAARRVAHGIVP